MTSNREPIEWLALMADPLLAQSAIDRFGRAAEVLLHHDLLPPVAVGETIASTRGEFTSNTDSST